MAAAWGMEHSGQVFSNPNKALDETEAFFAQSSNKLQDWSD